MNKYLFNIVLVFSLKLAFFNIALAQGVAVDSNKQSSSIKNSVELYNQAIDKSLRIFNGAEYKFADRSIKGDPFFITNLITPAVVCFDGVVYQDVPVWYDINKGYLITRNASNTAYYKMASSKVSWFKILNHTFIRIVADSVNSSVIHTGYYEKLYDGKISVFSSREKKIQSVSSYSIAERVFDEHDLYFIKKDNAFYAVNSKSIAFDLFKNKKKELKQYLRKNGINYRNSPEIALPKMASYYDQINN